MSTRRNTIRRVGEAGARGNQAPPQALSAAEQVDVNPVTLTDGQVRATLVQMV